MNLDIGEQLVLVAVASLLFSLYLAGKKSGKPPGPRPQLCHMRNKLPGYYTHVWINQKGDLGGPADTSERLIRPATAFGITSAHVPNMFGAPDWHPTKWGPDGEVLEVEMLKMIWRVEHGVENFDTTGQC
jgi:hypothetical protein